MLYAIAMGQIKMFTVHSLSESGCNKMGTGPNTTEHEQVWPAPLLYYHYHTA